MSTDNLKPCPFCGGKVFIGISDDEGNPRNEDYENDPWSGLSFTLIHENEQNEECPIATHNDEILGSLLYESRQEATDRWNDRQYC